MKGGQQMGCFDFTYADNGENIRGRNGYIYLSPQIAEKTNLPNQLRFYSTDAYGHFRLHIDTKNTYINIFTLYGILVRADINKTSEKDDRFMMLMRYRRFDDEYNDLDAMLRNAGFNYYCCCSEYKEDAFKITVPRLGNQKEKHLETDEVCWAETPLLISRKKLPVDVNTNLKKMAQTWGFVSAYDPILVSAYDPKDPKQGLHTTRNRYCKYINKS
jgi:hypothetical protein